MLLEDRSVPEAYHADLARIHQSGKKLISLIGKYLEDLQTEDAPEARRIRHDLRTPVNHIIGYAEILAEEAEDEERDQLKRDLEKIRDAGRTWLELMENRLTGDPIGGSAFDQKARSALLIKELQNVAPRDRATKTEATPGQILIVDDDALNRDVLARRLQQSGHEVESAVNGEAALEILAERPFDLVLLDMVMPGMGGAETLRRMKADPAMKEIPVIVISALDDEAGSANCIQLGAEDYLAKPFNPVVLRARIGSSLEKKRLREAERSYLATIEEERRKSEQLLLNVLPEAIANRLKAGEEGIAEQFAEVTVLFTDLVGFTQMSADHEPEEIVGMLNRIFSTFDVIAKRHGLEKIKTIGDAYMAVGGLPIPSEDHAEAIALFTIEIMKELEGIRETSAIPLELRVGISTGPVVAGIIGKSKFAYDLWGDTVNIASRMEMHGEPGRIQVSESTWEKLKDRFQLTYRGEIAVKGKGNMKTWFLEWE